MDTIKALNSREWCTGLVRQQRSKIQLFCRSLALVPLHLCVGMDGSCVVVFIARTVKCLPSLSIFRVSCRRKKKLSTMTVEPKDVEEGHLFAEKYVCVARKRQIRHFLHSHIFFPNGYYIALILMKKGKWLQSAGCGVVRRTVWPMPMRT